MVTFVEAGYEEDEKITRAKEKDHDTRNIDITCWTSRKKMYNKKLTLQIKSEVHDTCWIFRFGDYLHIKYDYNQESR